MTSTGSEGEVLSLIQSANETALSVTLNNADTTGAAISVIETAQARVNSLVTFARNATATGNVLTLTAAGQGDGLAVNLTSNTSGRAIAVGSTVATTVDLVSIRCDEDNATGNFLKISKSPTNATTGDALSIAMGSKAVGGAIAISHAAPATVIDVDHTGSGGRCIDIVSNTITDEVLYVKGTALTTGDALQIVVDNTMTTGKALRILGGATGTTDVFNVNEDGDVLIAGQTTDTGRNRSSVNYTAASTASTALITLFNTTTHGGTVSTLTSNGITFSSTNGRFSVPTGGTGTYEITIVVYLIQSANGQLVTWRLQKNGSTTAWEGTVYIHSSVDPVERSISVHLDLAAADYIQCQAQAVASQTLAIQAGTTFNIKRIA
jgi:hypothetical protein